LFCFCCCFFPPLNLIETFFFFRANIEINRVRRSNDSEMAVMRAALKKEQNKSASLEQAIQQKVFLLLFTHQTTSLKLISRWCIGLRCNLPIEHHLLDMTLEVLHTATFLLDDVCASSKVNVNLCAGN